MSSWGRSHYGDPCRECGFAWGTDPETAILTVRGAPKRLHAQFRDRDGAERIPGLAWSATGYLCHIGDNLRIWSERLVAAAHGETEPLSPYDADLLATARNYESVPVAGALWSVERAVRDWQHAISLAQKASVLLFHPDRGWLTWSDIAWTNAHDVFHHEWDISRLLVAPARSPTVRPATDQSARRAPEMLRDLFTRIADGVDELAEGLNPTDLNARIGERSNSVGWLLWHLTRGHDRNMAEVAGVEQVWLASEWYQQFGRAPDACDTGFRHTAEEAAKFQSPDARTIVEYHREVFAMIDSYLATVDDAELERYSHSPTLDETRLVRQRIADVISDAFQHLGQAANIRALTTRPAQLSGE